MPEDTDDLTLPLPTVRDEIRALEVFMKTHAYQDFMVDLGAEIDRLTDDVVESVPQNLGDAAQRERDIGALKWLKYAKAWFAEQLQAHKNDLAVRQPLP